MNVVVGVAMLLSTRVLTQAPVSALATLQAPSPAPAASVPPRTPPEVRPSDQVLVQSPVLPDQPTFRAGVEVVSLNITVTDRQGRLVTSLPQEAFSIFEDGAKQDVIFFSGAQLPTALALLLDTSASMNETLGMAQQAAIGFVERMRPDDLLAIVDFDSRAEILQVFTADRARLATGIRRTTAGGSTSLYNAVYIALHEFRKVRAANTQQDVRRQAIVVLSDGEDTSSLVPFEEVLDLAKRTEVAIYAISLRNDSDRGRTAGGFREADFVLRQLTQETGGRVFFPSNAGELAGIYSTVADELAAQYTVGYASRNMRRDGRWRHVSVRVERPDATARTKQGYYGPTE